MNIGITGHQRLDHPTAWADVVREIDAVLARRGEHVVGITSLAIGADQVFADAVLQRGGSLRVVVPFEGYEATFAEGPARDAYERLLLEADKVEYLEKSGTDEEAFFAAGKRVVDLADEVIAVWNGKPAAGLGGTADVVAYARSVGKPVTVITP
jgi:hypothetical protein